MVEVTSPCFWVDCTSCKVTTKSFYSKKEAEKAWNSRLNEGEWQALASALKLECIRLSKEIADEV